ncbi:MAG: hypothetical protein IE878_01605 [Epsilonproteobacteria bacterium]|nr:hypothetical protein [Campylobacterota bacterium]MBD3839066.1 hypothetical protein [Campylobacterota bacterium]
MLIWIPVDGNDEKNSIITTLDELKAWALVEFNNGVVEKIEFFEQRGTEERFVEFIVVKNRYENTMEFMQEGMMVLVARYQESIEEIMESFKFKELDELSI